MAFLLYDPMTSTRRVVDTPLPGDVSQAEPASGNGAVVVGRDASCDIVLPSPFVAPRHARVVRRGNSFFVECLSHASTHVANREARPGSPVRFDFGDELQVGPYCLAMIAPSRESDGAADEKELQQQLIAFEQQTHTRLLERLDLRLTRTTGKDDPAYVDEMLGHLEEVVDGDAHDVPLEVARFAVRGHLRRLVLMEIVRRARGRVDAEYRDSERCFHDPTAAAEIDTLVHTMVDSMPLVLDEESLGEDLAIAEESVDELLDAGTVTIPSRLERHILRKTVAKDVADVLLGFGPLQDLLEMPSVNEIMVVGHEQVYIEKNGVVQPATRGFFSEQALMSVIERILGPVGRRVDTSTPMVDARLHDGSRVNVVIPPLSLVGPCLTIRKFGWMPFTMDDLIERGTLSERVASFLRGCVSARKNMVISGGTGSGKTTLLNVLAVYAKPDERIVTIEESAELRLPQEHVVALEGRPANVEGRGAFGIRELVRNALRMRPDRIIVGEVRGPEALDMLQAMNTGHSGSLSTLHANTPEDAIKRLETLLLMAVEMPVAAIREQIVSALDVIVQVTRFADGRRAVTQIGEVVGIDPDTGRVRVEPIFTTGEMTAATEDPSRGDAASTVSAAADRPLRFTGYIPTFAEAMIDRGQLDVEVFL